MSRNTRYGFTLVELLVVIAIIGILVALLLPAIQAAREAARRSQCNNNIKQLAIGLHGYHDVHQVFPGGAFHDKRYAGAQLIFHGHTWIEVLFPFIEQAAAHDQIDFNVGNHQGVNPSVLNTLDIRSLYCPSDPDHGLFPNSRENSYTPGSTYGGMSMGANYVVSTGAVNWAGCTIPDMSTASPPLINCRTVQDPNNNHVLMDHPGMFSTGWQSYGMYRCTDGTSSTFLLGETLPIYSSLHMYFTTFVHTGNTNPPPNFHKVYTACPKSKDKRIGTCWGPMGGFKSQHPGGVQMAMVDGSVQFISDTIDYRTWVLLGDKADGEALSGF